MKLFVWDFHGVLEKGNDHAVLEITTLALQQGEYSRKMTLLESEFLTGRRWYEYFAFLLPELDQGKYFRLQSLCFEISINQPNILTKYLQIARAVARPCDAFSRRCATLRALDVDVSDPPFGRPKGLCHGGLATVVLRTLATARKNE